MPRDTLASLRAERDALRALVAQGQPKTGAVRAPVHKTDAAPFLCNCTDRAGERRAYWSAGRKHGKRGGYLYHLRAFGTGHVITDRSGKVVAEG